MKCKYFRLFTGLVIISFFLVTCSAGDNTESCQDKLDKADYSAVADDLKCDTYERASAYLGMAGFGFGSFLASGATDNFSKTLKLSKFTGADADGWKDAETGILRFYEYALCLVGPADLVTTLTAEVKCNDSGRRPVPTDPDGAMYERPRRDMEISFFAMLGELIVRTFGEIDKDRDGEITEQEQNSFTGLRQTVGEKSASDIDVSDKYFQIINNKGNVYFARKINTLITPTATFIDTNNDGIGDKLSYSYAVVTESPFDGLKCLKMVKNSKPDYTGVIPPSFDTDKGKFDDIIDLDQDGEGGCPQVQTITDIIPIIRMNKVTNIFEDNADITKPTDFISMYAQRATLLTDELEVDETDPTDDGLGFKSDSQFTKAVKESVDKMDNGGDCTTPAITMMDLITKIVSTAAISSNDDLATHNKLDLVDVSGLDPKAGTVSSKCPFPAKDPNGNPYQCNITVSTSRYIFLKSSGGYTDNLTEATTDVAASLKNLANLQLDASGKPLVVKAGDRVIAFKELACLSEQK
ncbi:hypothetical protein WDW89_01100 [Deltaproteobacteria bacterium TL4]